MTTQSRIEIINGRRFVFGGEWRVVGKASVIEKTARTDAKDEGMPLFGVRKNQLQYGLFNVPELPRFARMFSIAAALSDAAPYSVLGAFQFRDFYWIGQTKGTIVSTDGGDQIFADEVAAREAFNTLRERGGFQQVYAPDAWQIPGAKSADIARVIGVRTGGTLSRAKADYKLLIAAAAVAGLVGVVAYNTSDIYRYLAKTYFKGSKPPKILQSMAPPPQQPAHPPIGAIIPAAYTLAFCLNRVDPTTVGTPAPGLALNSILCGLNKDRALEAAYIYQAERASVLSAIRLTVPDADIQLSSRTVTLRELPPFPFPVLQPDQLTTRQDLETSLIAIGERFGGAATIAAQQLLPGQALTPWQRITFNLTTDQALPAFAGYLAALPGLSVNTIKYTARQKTPWTITGEAYVYPSR